jgi:hypothetical protein
MQTVYWVPALPVYDNVVYPVFTRFVPDEISVQMPLIGLPFKLKERTLIVTGVL